MEDIIINPELELMQGEAKKLFDHVVDITGMEHWKDSIRYYFPMVYGSKRLDQIIFAIEWFVGGKCEVTYIGNGTLRIDNDGYYVNIGA